MIKYVTVPKNGQISIGKKYAGVTLAIEETPEGLILTPGTFVADHHKDFFTPESMEALKAFNQYARENPVSDQDQDDAAKLLRDAIKAKKGEKIG